jgi:hypothetical protein
MKLLTLLLVVSGCGGATAKVQLANGALSTLGTNGIGTFSQALNVSAMAATEVKVKLQSLYMVPDIVGSMNQGEHGVLWETPQCKHGLSDAECAANNPQDFDLNLPSEQVNANLNAQPKNVPAGTYRYMIFALLGAQQAGHNAYDSATWAFSPDVPETIFPALQAETFVKFEPPLEVNNGDNLVVTLAYSLDNTVKYGPVQDLQNAGYGEKVPGAGTDQGPEKGDDCVDANGNRYCFFLPTFTVSARR